MKLTKSKLKQIIKEEIKNVQKEGLIDFLTKGPKPDEVEQLEWQQKAKDELQPIFDRWEGILNSAEGTPLPGSKYCSKDAPVQIPSGYRYPADDPDDLLAVASAKKGMPCWEWIEYIQHKIDNCSTEKEFDSLKKTITSGLRGRIGTFKRRIEKHFNPDPRGVRYNRGTKIPLGWGDMSLEDAKKWCAKFPDSCEKSSATKGSS